MKFVLNFVCVFVIVKNCNSASFVNISSVRVSRQTKTEGCILPQHPNLGQWSINQGLELSPGETAPPHTILQVNCKSNYKTDGEKNIVCINGEWTAKIGRCLLTCPSIHSTSIMNVTCTYNGIELKNCNEAIEGTIARFQCADFLEDVTLARHPVHFCQNGRWSHNLPECVPICGQKPVSDPSFIGERNAPKSEVPWQVGLYSVSNKDLLCGGTLLNQRIVLTAASCVTNEKGELNSNQIYMVAVGKYYQRFDHPDDLKYAQFSPVDEIYVPRQYKGDIQNFFGDIAILVTNKTFQLSVRVLPVCVDWGFQYQNILLNHTRKTDTFVSGWKFIVENKNPSETLKALQVPLISEELCSRNMPEEYARYFTDDKLCAGFLEDGKAVGKGDHGGGLVTRLGGRFYIIGVLSLSPRPPTIEGGSDNHQYALYTKVHYYTDSFLLEKEAEFRPSTLENVDCEDDSNCTI